MTRTVRHKKRGTTYEVVGIGRMQSERWLDHTPPSGPGFTVAEHVDMREVVVYRSLQDGSIWVRPVEEFEDGRFEEVSP